MRIGKLEVTAPFFLMLAWLNYLDRQGLVPLCVLACCFHELGHLLSIRLLSGDIKLIRLTAVGAEMVLCRPMGYGQEMVAALAGPGVNLLLAVLCCRWSWGTLFAGLNLALGCFNLLPVGRLDGGRFLHGLLAVFCGLNVAEQIGALLDGCLVGSLLLAGALLAWKNGNITLLSVGLWLLVVFSKGKKRGNRACLIDKKKVKSY